MTTLSIARPKPAPTGLRPVNARTDMLQMADLIGLAFEGELDTSGKVMLRDMRSFGRLGWVGWLGACLLLPEAAHPRGFVWVGSPGVVGNASLLRVEGYPRRWVLANVAVHPAWRRRGIARALTNACLQEARREQADEVILQVNSERHAPQALYRDLGFVDQTMRRTWLRRNSVPVEDDPFAACVRPRRDEEWELDWEMARRQMPEGFIWPFPPRSGTYRPPRPSGLAGPPVRHWVWWEEGRLIASLTALPRYVHDEWRLILASEPDGWGSVEAGLLRQACRELPASARMLLEYPPGRADTAIASLGFVPGRCLTWMRLDLRRGASEGQPTGAGRSGPHEPAGVA
jgi:ribosomal protein S18 acetylase RimI-like enzyme